MVELLDGGGPKSSDETGECTKLGKGSYSLRCRTAEPWGDASAPTPASADTDKTLEDDSVSFKVLCFQRLSNHEAQSQGQGALPVGTGLARQAWQCLVASPARRGTHEGANGVAPAFRGIARLWLTASYLLSE